MHFRLIFNRLHGANFKKMWDLVCQIHDETNKMKGFILLDMIWCAVRYGIGYLEYRVFGFAYIRGAKRKTFMTMRYNISIIREVNNSNFNYLFEDKIEFNKKFKKYIGREWRDLRELDLYALSEFLKDKKEVFVKRLDGCGGKDVEKILVEEIKNLDQFYKDLMEKKQFLIEESLVQHHKMNELCSSSINTIRIVSVLSEGIVHIMYSLIRIGDGTKSVDNISSGGMYSPIDEEGVIFKKAFCDATGKYYEKHPYTNTSFVGFKIPFYKEAIEMVKRAALEVPQVRYIGWDVAICKDGPVFIEGNTIPGYDMCQNYYHLKDEKVGILGKFEEVLGKQFH